MSARYVPIKLNKIGNAYCPYLYGGIKIGEDYIFKAAFRARKINLKTVGLRISGIRQQ